MDLTEPVLLTPEGLEKLKRDLEVALRRRSEAGERLKEAFQPGDIEDNPEYEQAKEEVGLLDSRIYELQEMIGRAQIIRDTHSSVVGPGSTIEVVDHELSTAETTAGYIRRTLRPALGDMPLRKLQHRVDVLDRPRFRGDPRHRSVADTIRWSYDLLSPEAARLFEELAVFAGPFSGATARVVASVELSRFDALLDELTYASLVTVDTGGPETRYRLLETVRQFARELRHH